MMSSTTLIDTIDDHINSIRVRIVTVGDVGVGKSCLIKKYCEPDKFVKAQTPTIGVDYGVKSASVKRNVDVRIDFFDLSGDGDYFEVRNEFYKSIDAILFVFDVTNEKSFESLAMWLDEAEKYGLSSSSEESAMRVIVGNKIDLYPREVTEQQGKSFASRCSATYFETSAKTGASIDEMFQFILNKTVHLRRDSYRKSPHQRPPLLSD